MSWLSRYFKSSVGAKHIMAVSGLLLSLFVFAHMLGNLQIFIGQEQLNAYGKSLQDLKGLLWVARIILLLLVIAHVLSALRLVVLNKAARPVRYQVYKPRVTPFYKRVMPWTGLIVLAFIVYHLLHFTVGAVQHDSYVLADAKGRHDVYRMVVIGFSSVPVAISYIVAMALLCFHLSHGVTSMFQSLGLNHPKYNGFFDKAGPVFAIIIFVGNTSIPLAVLTDLVRLPGV
jgi:succinate dehydrogenase / fumarate reductase cytochrome b subunit